MTTSTPRATPSPAWVRRVPSYAGGAVSIIGTAMLIGWIRHFAVLAGAIPALPTMKANTTISVLFAGLSLVGRVPAQRWLALVPLTIGSATLVEWITGHSIGIDQLMVNDPFTALEPGRPSSQAATAMVTFAVGRLLTGGRQGPGRVGGLVTAAYACLVLVLDLGWIFHARELASLKGGPGLTGPSATCITLLALGLAALHADRRPLVYLWDSGPAGTVVRRLLPWVILAPPTLGLVPVLTHNLNLGTAAFAGSMMLLLAVVVTVTAQSIHRVEADRARISRELEAIFDSVPAAMTMRDPQGRLLRYNRARATDAAGTRIDPAAAARPPLVEHPDELAAQEATALESRRPVTRAYGPTPDGTEYEVTKFPVYDVDGSVIGIGGFALDVTARSRAERALREAEQRARQLAERDPLTGIWNRRWFEAELRTVLVHLPAEPGGALMIVDIDHFKLVNDTAGHQAGDLLLVAVAQALVKAVPEPGSVSRIGGDEFAVVLPRGNRAIVERTAARVVDTVHRAAADAGMALATASVGVAVFADLPVGERTEQLALVRADEALYGAKRAGRDRHHTYCSPASPAAWRDVPSADSSAR